MYQTFERLKDIVNKQTNKSGMVKALTIVQYVAMGSDVPTTPAVFLG